MNINTNYLPNESESVYIVDSGASVHIFNKNPNKKFSVRQSNSIVEGIGKEKIVAIGEDDNMYIGRYLIIPQCKTNLLSVSELTKKGIQVHFNDTATLQTSREVYPLRQSSDGLYFIQQSQLQNIIEDQMKVEQVNQIYQITSTDTSEASFTPKQKLRAAEVHKLHYSLDHPSNISLKNMLKYGLITNTTLVPGDVDLYATIYGKCPHCIEGKTNAPTYDSSTSETVNSIGKRIHMDLKPMKEVQVNGGHSYMIISVDEYSGFLHGVTCKTKLKEDVYDGFKEIIAFYKSYQHKVESIMTDSEQTFKALETEIRMLGIQAFYTTPYQHAQRIERYIQTINKRMSSVLASLPYVLPHRLYAELIYDVINNINLVPNTLHPTQTPSVMFMEIKYDQLACTKPPFGTPAMFHQVAKDVGPRSQLGIILSYNITSHFHQVRAWIIQDSRIKIRSHYTVVKAYPRDLLFPARNISVPSHLPDYFQSNLPKPKTGTTTIQTLSGKTSVDSVGSQSQTTLKRVRPETPNDTLPADHRKEQRFTERKLIAADIAERHSNEPELMVAERDDNTTEFRERSTERELIASGIESDATSSTVTSDRNGVDENVTGSSDSSVDAVDDVNTTPDDNDIRDDTVVHTDIVDTLPVPSTNAVTFPIDLQGESNVMDSNLYTTRSGRKVIRKAFITSNDLTISQALAGDRPEESKRAIISEIKNMIEYSVGYFISLPDIPIDLRKHIIRSFMFIKHKQKPNGMYDKTKARLVVNGKHQPESSYEELSSHTIDLSSVFILFNIASYYRSDISCYDIRGAFLNASFTEDDPVIYIRIDSDVVNFWKDIDESIISYLNSDGSVIIKLSKYLYGLKQSPLKFQQHLQNTLMSAGYENLISDPCLYQLKQDNKLNFLSTHVDDIMNVSNDSEQTLRLQNKLRDVYKDISVQDPATSYIGIDIKRGIDKRDIFLSQPKLVNEILKWDNSDKVSKTPSTNDIYRQSDDDQKISQKKYLSIIMKIMYLGRLTRPDLLFSVTYLASKCQHPTIYDYKHVIRLIRYIRYTKDYVLHIHCDNLQTNLYTDASYGSHYDGKSHTGYVLTIGNNNSYIHGVSLKQKVGSASSTDAEIIALHTGVKYLSWIRSIFLELDIEDVKSTMTYQDNRSTILLCSMKSTTIKRVKHLLSKISFIRLMVENKDIILHYIESDDMVADILTKPLQSSMIDQHRENIGIKMQIQSYYQ